MEPISTILMSAAGYILKGAAQSKTGEKAKEELLGKFWKWIKPKFLSEASEIEEKPEDPATSELVQQKLIELVKDEAFFKQLQTELIALHKAGIRAKNIVDGSITRVKKVRIGDQDYSADGLYQQKNIVRGDVSDGEEFTLGDGR